MLAMMPVATPVAAIEAATLPSCGGISPASAPDGIVVSPWRAVLDGNGVVTEHRLTLRRQGVDITIRAGRRGFATPVGAERVLFGERSRDGTTLTMIDTGRACRLWERTLDRLAYDVTPLPGGMALRLAVHEPATRLYEGALVIDAQTGATEAMIEGACTTACEPNDGDLLAAAFEAAGAPRPVPAFAAGGWAPDKTLPFRWRASAVPPDWAKPPLKNAARDAVRSSGSRSPTFVFRRSANNSVRYTSVFPTFCRFGIACASRAMPSWAVWIRPHGTDFSWGTLRWCQKKSRTGCFDLRRVMLHELGHISGLNHPSSAGFTLAPYETVMHAITPARPSASSSKHAYGRCDVATLQELYDVPDREAPISSCNDLATQLSLTSSAALVPAGGSVRLRGRLRIADHSDYGLLRSNALNGRSVKLKYRRAGSHDPWTTAWMKPLSGAGRYGSTISPRATWEFKATFPAPASEGLRFSRSSVLKVKVKS